MTISVKEQILPFAVAIAFTQFKSSAPTGWVEFDIGLRQYPPQSWFSLDFKACTLEQALDKLVSTEGHYRWERRNGAIIFSPISDPSNIKIVARLSQVVKQFNVRFATLDEAYRELIAELQREGIGGFTTSEYSWPIESTQLVMSKPFRITLNMRNKTILECIEAINLAYGQANQWIARPLEDNTILIRSSGFEVAPWSVDLSADEFSRHQAFTTRLAELRGKEVVDHLSPEESHELNAVFREYRAFMLEHAKKRYRPGEKGSP